MKKIVKGIANGIGLVVAFPLALISAFGRIEPVYLIGAQIFALAPGLIGDYLRIAFYKLTLEECSLESRVQFGSFFVHPNAKIGRRVYVGCYCVLGRVAIGDRTHLASGVQTLSGRRQHGRDEQGHVTGAEQGVFETIMIGSDCWIGAAATVMADIGDGTTIGAGAVVIKPVPPGSVAVGNPARVIKSVGESVETS